MLLFQLSLLQTHVFMSHVSNEFFAVALKVWHTNSYKGRAHANEKDIKRQTLVW